MQLVWLPLFITKVPPEPCDEAPQTKKPFAYFLHSMGGKIVQKLNTFSYLLFIEG
jgi:hypothetical protein